MRYTWGDVPFLQLAQSLNKRGYFCHGTAVSLHELVKLSKKTIYLNAEQSTKSFGASPLRQDAIDRAFSGKQRQSKLIYKCKGMSVVMISGKNTAGLGVEDIEIAPSNTVKVTNLERTLIDIAVRPAYAGGPSEVLKAYRAAISQVSDDRLVSILKKLDYVYPYHQAIGFLMHMAGYPETSYAKLKALGLHHDFYLAHGLQAPQHSAEWRLFYPKGLT